MNPDLSRRLAIIVPYRNRPEQLAQFLPHMSAYFQRDKQDRHIDVSIHVVEQADEAAFNRGKLVNCGFELVRREAEYVVIHDVDYLPIWADYSYTACPTRLIWHGLVLQEDQATFFGAVIGLSCADFLAANGFSNRFVNWGAEDMDFRNRCLAAGLRIAARDGTFHALRHPHNGILPDGSLRAEVRPNFALLASLWPRGPCPPVPDEGLRTLDFEVVSTATLQADRPRCLLHAVRWPTATAGA